MYDDEIFKCVAELCDWLKPKPHSDDILLNVLNQIELPEGYKPEGNVVIPLTNYFRDDTYWTTGVSPRTSALLHFKTCPGFNKLGQVWDKYFRMQASE